MKLKKRNFEIPKAIVIIFSYVIKYNDIFSKIELFSKVPPPWGQVYEVKIKSGMKIDRKKLYFGIKIRWKNFLKN